MSKASRRYYRTVILGVLAMSTLIWMAVDQFDISVDEMLSLFYATLIGAAAIILAAATVVVIWAVFRKLMRRNRS